MAKGVNKVILVGTLGKDPEVRRMPNGDAVATYSIAVNEEWKDKSGAKQKRTEWVNIVAFGRLGEICGEYLKTASVVYIEGKIRTRQWEKDGQKRYRTEVVADEMQMLSGKRDGEHRQHDSPQETQYQGADQDPDDSPPF